MRAQLPAQSINAGEHWVIHISTTQILYACTVFCAITLLRKEGLRLRREEWAAPVHGRLTIRDDAANNFRRTVRQANLLARDGTTERAAELLFDPVIFRDLPDGFVMRGIELKAHAGRLWEFEQVWMCRLTPGGSTTLHPYSAETLAKLEKILPST